MGLEYPVSTILYPMQVLQRFTIFIIGGIHFLLRESAVKKQKSET